MQLLPLKVSLGIPIVFVLLVLSVGWMGSSSAGVQFVHIPKTGCFVAGNFVDSVHWPVADIGCIQVEVHAAVFPFVVVLHFDWVFLYLVAGRPLHLPYWGVSVLEELVVLLSRLVHSVVVEQQEAVPASGVGPLQLCTQVLE